jgi:hypothetical protein
MKILKIVNLILLFLLSVSAGIAKSLQLPQEMEFLQKAGFNGTMVVILGVIQVVGGALILPARTRTTGAVLAGTGFLISSVTIFASGNIGFGISSLVPAMLAVLLIVDKRNSSELT